MKALYVQMMDLYFIFQFDKGRCILCTFVTWQHGFVSLLLAMGQHCGAERAIRFAMHF